MTKTLPDFDLSHFLPYRLTLAAERASAGLARRYRVEFGLSVAEWRVLAHLADAGTVSVRDLEARVSLEKSKASRAASRLAARGLIDKGPHAGDRRLVSLSLSTAGRRLMADLLPRALAYQARLEALVAADLAGLDAALDRLIDAEI